jgi:RNA polymerase sigma-70 factor (ECF subfamily)
MAVTAAMDGVVADGLEEQFEALVASHRDRAVGLAWRLVGGDAAAAEDVAQEAFLKAHRALGHFRGEAKLSTWFYRILVRQAATYRRWRAVREVWGAEPPEPADPGAEVRGDPGLRRRIAQAVDGLTRRQREAFVLVHLEGLSLREAAEVMGSRVGTVKSHLHRALAQLRRELADIEPSGEST